MNRMITGKDEVVKNPRLSLTTPCHASLVEKITLNMGAGYDQLTKLLDKADLAAMVKTADHQSTQICWASNVRLSDHVVTCVANAWEFFI